MINKIRHILNNTYQATKNIFFVAGNLKFDKKNKAVVSFLSKKFPLPPPTRHQMAYGGEVKMTYLAERFPHVAKSSKILYIVSSVSIPGRNLLVRLAKYKGLKIVLNQNGVFAPSWAGPGYAKGNRPLASLHHMADFVVYQSEFCQRSAERFLGEVKLHSTVLFNPVDLSHYQPGEKPNIHDGLHILAIFSAHRWYRLESAIRCIQLVRKKRPNSILRFMGVNESNHLHKQTKTRIERFCIDLGLDKSAIAYDPPFTRQTAPTMFNKGHILIHTSFNDASPNLVCEAMACGIPVVYSASGGVPELVGPDAGIGIPAPNDYERIHPPPPEALAEGVLKITNNWYDWSIKARLRAEKAFDLKNYISAHEKIFEELVSINE